MALLSRLLATAVPYTVALTVISAMLLAVPARAISEADVLPKPEAEASPEPEEEIPLPVPAPPEAHPAPPSSLTDVIRRSDPVVEIRKYSLQAQITRANE